MPAYHLELVPECLVDIYISRHSCIDLDSFYLHYYSRKNMSVIEYPIFFIF